MCGFVSLLRENEMKCNNWGSEEKVREEKVGLMFGD